MNCALWLNRKKISSASEIRGNLDIASLRGYFLAGSLIPWLKEHGGEVYAKRLESLDHNDPQLNDKIARAFGGRTEDTAPFKALDGGFADTSGTAPASGASFVWESFIGSGSLHSYTVPASFESFRSLVLSSGKAFSSAEFRNILTSYTNSSFSSFFEWEWLWKALLGYTGSFTVTSGGSFTYGWEWLWKILLSYGGSFTASSGGSFAYGWEWLWELLLSYRGSFAATSGGSFTYGWEWLWELLSNYGGSFAATSGGSFTYGWEWLQKLLGGAGSFGSFGYGSFGSFDPGMFDHLNDLPKLDEYDLVLLKTLISCPLDRFGYGIHNI